MQTITDWDFDIGEKTIPLTAWEEKYEWVEEPQISPDGEKIAAIVNLGEEGFDVCVNGETWGNPVDKAWYLRFSPEARLAAIVSSDGEWTMGVDGSLWENRFDFVWNVLFSKTGGHIAAAWQKDGEYGMVLDDEVWENGYVNISGAHLSANGKSTAAVVQALELSEGDIFKFAEGVHTAVVNGQAWPVNYINLWGLTFNTEADQLAAEVRLDRFTYTISVNGKNWLNNFNCVWAPRFHPFNSDKITAPVKIGPVWTLAENGNIIWNNRFVQLWEHCYSSDGASLAAIGSTAFGKWTIVVNDQPWRNTFNEMVIDPTFSPDGTKVAAAVKHDGKWTIVVNDQVWDKWFQQVYPLVFSPDGNWTAAAVEINGKYTYSVNGRVWNRFWDYCRNPVFSPDSSKILLGAIKNGVYHRLVLPVSEITG